MSLATRVASCAVLVAAPLILVGAQAYAVGPAPTSVQTVSPLTASGAVKSSYRIVRHLGDGVCQTGSYQTGSAYRCSSPEAGAGILDPCWPLATAASTVVCQDKPWDRAVVELHVLGTAAGGPGSRAATLPWGLRIGASVRCLRDVGSVLRIDGHALLYHCSQHRDVFGPLQSSGALWRAHVYRNDAHTPSGEKSLGWAAIAIAWRGAPAVPPTSPSPTPTAAPTTTATPAT